MKTIIIILLSVMSLAGFSRSPLQDTLFVSDISGNDTIIWIPRGYCSFGAKFRIEFEYTSFDDDDAYIKPCSKSIPNTVIYMNIGDAATDTALILNVTSNIDSYSGTAAARFVSDDYLADEFGFYFNKGSVTNDTLIYNVRQE